VRSNSSSIDFAVFDTDGNTVVDLQGEDFELFLNGLQQEIPTLAPPDTPWNMLFLLDRSLTLNRGRDHAINRWGSLVISVTRLVEALDPDDRVSFALFDAEVEAVLDWHSADGDWRAALGMNEPPDRYLTGAKDIYGALDWAVENLEDLDDRGAVFVFTDGRDRRLSPQWFRNERGPEVIDPLFGLPDQGEREAFERTLRNVADGKARFFFVTVFGDQPRNWLISNLFPGAGEAVIDHLARVRTRLERFAAASNGAVLYYDTPHEAIESFPSLYGRLALGSRYTIGLSQPVATVEIRTVHESLAVDSMLASGP
jgi:hypothetical protein